jgi:hypothetical protein
MLPAALRGYVSQTDSVIHRRLVRGGWLIIIVVIKSIECYQTYGFHGFEVVGCHPFTSFQPLL